MRSSVPERAGIVALALMVSVPFLNPMHIFPLLTFYEECLALALGIAAILALALRHAAFSARIPQVSLWTVVLGAFVLLQPAWKDLPYDEPARIAGLYLFWAAALMWAGAQLRLLDAQRACDVIAGAVLAAAAVNAAVALLQSFGLDQQMHVPAALGGRPFGLLAQPNLQANLMVMGLASAAYLHARGRLPAVLSLLLALLISAGIVLAQSRAAILEIVALACVVFRFRHAGPDTSRMGRALLIGAGALCAIWLALVALQAPVVPAEAAQAPTRDYEIRLSIWEAALRIWLDAPITGTGVGGFAWAHYTTPTPWTGPVPMRAELYAHNIVLQFLAETGMAGTLLLACVLVPWGVAALRHGSVSDDPWKPWAVGLVGVQLAHSLVEFPLWHAHFLGVAALSMGLAEPRMYVMRSARLANGAFLVAAVLGGALVAATARGHYLLLWDTTATGKEQAARLRALERSLLRPYVEVGLSRSISPAPDALEDKIAFNGRVMHFWPVSDIVQRQILLLAQAGRDAQAIDLVGNLERLDPAAVAELSDRVRASSALPPESSVRRDLELRAARVHGD